MPNDDDKYCNLHKAFTAIEKDTFLRMKSIEMKKDIRPLIRKNRAALKKMEILLKERNRLFDITNKESRKPQAPPDLFFKDTKKYELKPYQYIYLDELMWIRTYYQKPIWDPFAKAAKRALYGTSKEKFDDIMRLIRIYTKKTKTVKNLRHLRFTDKLEEEERGRAIALQVITSYLISKYISQMINGFEVIIKKRKVTIVRPDLSVLEAQIDNHTIMDSILEKIISISTSLQDKMLSEEIRKDYIQSREKLREHFKFAMSYEIRRALQNGEDFENIGEEALGALKDAMKFVDLWSEAYDQVFLEEPKVDGLTKELTDIYKLLSETNLTTEERKYFLKREAVLEKEVDWEGNMKILMADFPYSPFEKNRYTAKKLKKSLLSKDIIFHYLKKKSGKAFTAQALYNRLDEIGLEEEVKVTLNVDALEDILIDLYEIGKITRQDKEGKTYYLF